MYVPHFMAPDGADVESDAEAATASWPLIIMATVKVPGIGFVVGDGRAMRHGQHQFEMKN